MNPKNHPHNPRKGSAPVCNGHPTLIAYHSSTLAALTLIKLFVENVQISKTKKQKKTVKESKESIEIFRNIFIFQHGISIIN